MHGFGDWLRCFYVDAAEDALVGCTLGGVEEFQMVVPHDFQAEAYAGMEKVFEVKARLQLRLEGGDIGPARDIDQDIVNVEGDEEDQAGGMLAVEAGSPCLRMNFIQDMRNVSMFSYQRLGSCFSP